MYIVDVQTGVPSAQFQKLVADEVYDREPTNVNFYRVQGYRHLEEAEHHRRTADEFAAEGNTGAADAHYLLAEQRREKAERAFAVADELLEVGAEYVSETGPLVDEAGVDELLDEE